MKLHRSLIFWAGLLVMAAVLWGWWDSRSYYRQVGNVHLVLGSATDGLVIQSETDSGPEIEFVSVPLDTAELGRGSPWLEPLFLQKKGMEGELERVLPGLIDEKGDFSRSMDLRISMAYTLLAYGKPGNWMLYVPYWLVTLIVTAAWAIGLSWRWRRIKRPEKMMGGEE